MVPRKGAFEVSTVYKYYKGNEENPDADWGALTHVQYQMACEARDTELKQEFLFFSKMMSGMWPHANALAERIADFVQHTSHSNKGV